MTRRRNLGRDGTGAADVGLSEGTREAVRDLRSIGAQHGRETTPADAQAGGVAIAFPGVPSITVRLDAGLEDTVTIDDVVAIEVPRRDTLAVVEAVFAGRAHLRRHEVARWGAVWLALLAPLRGRAARSTRVLVVPVPGGSSYEKAVPGRAAGGWLAGLPAEL